MKKIYLLCQNYFKDKRTLKTIHICFVQGSGRLTKDNEEHEKYVDDLNV